MFLAPDEPLSLPAADDTESEEDQYLDEEVRLDLLPNDDGDDLNGPDDPAVRAEIHDLSDDPAEPGEAFEIDIGRLLEVDSDDEGGSPAEDTLFNVDPASGLALPDELGAFDDAEGVLDATVVVDESALPELDTDDASEGIRSEPEFTLGAGSDEEPAPIARELWIPTEPLTRLEACGSLAIGGAELVAGSSDLLWFHANMDAPLRVAACGSSIASVVLVGATHEIAVAATRTGQLLRRGRYASQAEPLLRFRELGSSAPGTRLGLSLSRPRDFPQDSFLLATESGLLLESSDAGEHFERLEPGGRVLALAATAATALVANGRDRSLARLAADRLDFDLHRLTGRALSVARGAKPILTQCDDVVALATPEHALVVSNDGGQTFQSVPGTAGATAITSGRYGDRTCVWATLYREADDRSELLQIDPALATALCVARLESPPAEHVDPSDRSEWARVAALEWHVETHTLWAVGGFGVVRFAPPART
jgi:hypothetical protein